MGHAVFIPSGEMHSTQCVEPGELITINAELGWCEENCDLPLSVLRKTKVETANGKALEGTLRQAAALLRGTAAMSFTSEAPSGRLTHSR
jgi:hypothetical protein